MKTLWLIANGQKDVYQQKLNGNLLHEETKKTLLIFGEMMKVYFLKTQIVGKENSQLQIQNKMALKGLLL